MSHLIACVLAIFGTALLVQRSSGAREHSAVLVYGAGLALSMATSFAYNRARARPAVAPALRRADRAAIFGLIAGTYTPFLAALDKSWSWVLLAVVWVAAVLGALAMLLWNDLPRRVGAVLYLAFGWVFVAFIPSVSHRLGTTSGALLVAGGVLYSLGAAVYITRTPNPSPRWFGYHEVFHLFVVAAVATHFAAVYRIT